MIKKSLLSFAAQEADRLAILLGILTTSLALIDAYQACDGPGD